MRLLFCEGNLTMKLLEVAKKVVAVELDRRMVSPPARHGSCLRDVRPRSHLCVRALIDPVMKRAGGGAAAAGAGHAVCLAPAGVLPANSMHLVTCLWQQCTIDAQVHEPVGLQEFSTIPPVYHA